MGGFQSSAKNILTTPVHILAGPYERLCLAIFFANAQAGNRSGFVVDLPFASTFLNTFIAPQEWITLTERCWKCGMSLAIGLSLLTNVLKSTLVRNDGFNRYCRCDLAMTLLLVPFPVHFGMGFWAQELQLFDLCLSLWKLSTLARSCEFGTPHQAGTEVLL